MTVTDTNFITGLNGILFYPEKHKYRHPDGAWIPSVTKIFKALGLNRFDGDPYYGDRGQRVHKVCEMHLRGKLNPAMVEEDEMPYYNAFISWWDVVSVDYEVAATELILGNRKFAGTLDILLKHKETGELVVVDLKTSATSAEWHFLQVQAYANLCGTAGMYPEEKRVVYLKKNGEYDEKIINNEYKDMWDKLLNLAGQHRPMMQKNYLAQMIIKNIIPANRKLAEIVFDKQEKKKKAEKDYETARELLCNDLGEGNSGTAMFNDGRLFIAGYVSGSKRRTFNPSKFWTYCNRDLDQATIKMIRKFWAMSFDLKISKGYHKMEVLDSEHINLPLWIRTLELTPDQCADEIMVLHHPESIKRYFIATFGEQWTERNLKNFRGNVTEFVAKAIETSRKALYDCGDMGEYIMTRVEKKEKSK